MNGCMERECGMVSGHEGGRRVDGSKEGAQACHQRKKHRRGTKGGART